MTQQRINGYRHRTHQAPDWRLAVNNYLTRHWWAIEMPDGQLWERFARDGRHWGEWLRVDNRRSLARLVEDRVRT